MGIKTFEAFNSGELDKSRLSFKVFDDINEPIISRDINGNDIHLTYEDLIASTSAEPFLWVIFYGGDAETEDKYTCEFPEEDIFDDISFPDDMYEVSEGIFGYDGPLSKKELTDLLSQYFRLKD